MEICNKMQVFDFNDPRIVSYSEYCKLNFIVIYTYSYAERTVLNIKFYIKDININFDINDEFKTSILDINNNIIFHNVGEIIFVSDNYQTLNNNIDEDIAIFIKKIISKLIFFKQIDTNTKFAFYYNLPNEVYKGYILANEIINDKD